MGWRIPVQKKCRRIAGVLEVCPSAGFLDATRFWFHAQEFAKSFPWIVPWVPRELLTKEGLDWHAGCKLSDRATQ